MKGWNFRRFRHKDWTGETLFIEVLRFVSHLVKVGEANSRRCSRQRRLISSITRRRSRRQV
ncbi:MAG: hypothetical protein JW902_06955 [Syntrophaceae bacterium]|nr:hypothetical protein [Syntrophaceae bacterium]